MPSNYLILSHYTNAPLYLSIYGQNQLGTPPCWFTGLQSKVISPFYNVVSMPLTRGIGTHGLHVLPWQQTGAAWLLRPTVNNQNRHQLKGRTYQVEVSFASVQFLPTRTTSLGIGMPKNCKICIARGSLELVIFWQQWVASSTLQLLRTLRSLANTTPSTKATAKTTIASSLGMKLRRVWVRNAMGSKMNETPHFLYLARRSHSLSSWYAPPSLPSIL